VGISGAGIDPAYVPIGHRYLGAPPQLDAGDVAKGLGEVLNDAGVKKHIHGSKDARLACMTLGLSIDGVIGDPDLAAYLIDPTRTDEKQRQKQLSALAGGFGAIVEEKEALCGKGKKAVGYDTVEVPRAADYAARRAEATLAVSKLLRAEIEKKGMAPLLDEMELPLARVLAVIERHGVLIDTAALGSLGDEMARRMDSIEREVTELAGYEVNLGSPKQLQDLLFGKLQLPATKKTKTGYSTDAEVLEELAAMNPIAAKILEHRGLAKLKGTYVDSLPHLVSPKTGRVHTTYHQTVAGTGRLSSSDPNLQNIPIRTDIGKLIRRAFIAAPGHVLIAADYSQIELRVLAHLSGDPVLTDAFTRDEDVHTRTAREVFGVEDAAVSAEMRRVSKAINYGLVYGQTDFGLAQAARIPREDAKKYITAYFARYAGVKSYMDRLISDGYTQGGARTLFGRFRPIPEMESKNRTLRQMGERMARNTPIQGTAADLLKLAMIAVQARLDAELPSVRMLLTVHDELVLEAPAEQAERAAAMVKEAMENVHRMAVPLRVDVGAGANWAEC
jgi:DNA polymerase-1